MFIRRLIWDVWNVAHIARHQVNPEEVEEVCHSQPVISETYGRVRVIGQSRTGRTLTVILAPKGRGDYYPVTARPASRNERQLYEKKGGETQ